MGPSEAAAYWIECSPRSQGNWFLSLVLLLTLGKLHYISLYLSLTSVKWG